ncbi:MAG: DUF1292 domain-containing protein [Lachnospiraceae bacterium]|nr:DUF1292 domain-containing protein [Lachnospiraceae bacterium]
MENTIVFTDTDGMEVELTIIAKTQFNGNTYLLAQDIDDEDDSEEEALAYIMIEKDNDGEDSVYEIVEDDKEIEAVASIFEELLEGEFELVPDEE